MFYKECTDDPLYEKLVKAYDEVSPSADTKVFVAGILIKNGKTSEAESYFKEAYDLESDTFKKVLEQVEMLEQLRAMENGIRIYVMESNVRVVGIDTPDDLIEAEKQLSEVTK